MRDRRRPEPEHLARLRAGVQAWNTWREENPLVMPYLGLEEFPGINLRGADLHNVTFSRANLQNADLAGAGLYQAEFYSADLRGANLRNSDLRGAKFHNADARGANFENSDLFRVDFIGTRLAGARFAYARCHTTTFAAVDLSQIEGIEHVQHTGPSNIDISTLIMTRRPYPVEFLQLAGIPKSVLEYLPYFASPPTAVEFPSCFISYSSKDESFVRLLYDRLRATGLRVWFAPEELKGGKLLMDQIDQAIQLHDRLLIVLSEGSMKSSWVEAELIRARERELQENRRVLFPIRLVSFEALRQWTCFDPDTGKDVAREVRAYFIPDFSDWRNESAFQLAFAQLVKSLRAAESEMVGELKR